MVPGITRRTFGHGGHLVSYLDASGDTTAPSRGTLLFLHAFPLASAMWEPQLAALPPGWRGLAPDLRGFGGSAAFGDEPTIDDYAADAVVLLDEARVPSAVVVGLSMGGYAAFALFRRAAPRVRALVLADTRPDPDTGAGVAARRRSLASLEQGGVPAVVESMLPRLLGPTTAASRPAVVAAVRALASAQPPRGVADGIHRLMTRPDSMPTLPTIDVPTLVVVGDEDEVTPVDVARGMTERIAGAELALVSRAGHLANLERPEPFNLALDRFLSRLPAA